MAQVCKYVKLAIKCVCVCVNGIKKGIATGMRLLCDRCHHQRLARAAAVFKTFAYEMVRDKNNLDHLHRG